MKVHVTRAVTITATPTGNVHYEAGYRGLAPRDHVRRIEAAGCGKRLAADAPDEGIDAPDAPEAGA